MVGHPDYKHSTDEHYKYRVNTEETNFNIDKKTWTICQNHEDSEMTDLEIPVCDNTKNRYVDIKRYDHTITMKSVETGKTLHRFHAGQYNMATEKSSYDEWPELSERYVLLQSVDPRTKIIILCVCVCVCVYCCCLLLFVVVCDGRLNVCDQLYSHLKWEAHP